METLHAILKKGREAANLNQAEAAIKLGIKSRETISRVENGMTPSVDLLRRMISVYSLDYTLPQLMTMKIKPENGLSNDELLLLRAYRNNDVDKAMKIIAKKAYHTAPSQL